MSLTFYYAPMSTAEITKAVIDQLGIPCDRITVDLAARETRNRKFLAINPNGSVPVIIHDRVVIWESAAITLYLGEVFGVERGLYPPPGPQRGHAMKWVVWSNVTLAEAALRLIANTDDNSGGLADGDASPEPSATKRSGEFARAKADIAHCFQILDGALSSSDFLLDTYTIVDTHVHSLAEYATMVGADIQAFPRLASWIKRVSERLPGEARA